MIKISFCLRHFLIIISLRKHVDAIYRYFLVVQNLEFHSKCVNIFLICSQNIDCGYTSEPPWQGGSNEYPQSMFWSKNNKNMHTPAYPIFSITQLTMFPTMKTAFLRRFLRRFLWLIGYANFFNNMIFITICVIYIK